MGTGAARTALRSSVEERIASFMMQSVFGRMCRTKSEVELIYKIYISSKERTGGLSKGRSVER